MILTPSSAFSMFDSYLSEPGFPGFRRFPRLRRPSASERRLRHLPLPCKHRRRPRVCTNWVPNTSCRKAGGSDGSYILVYKATGGCWWGCWWSSDALQVGSGTCINLHFTCISFGAFFHAPSNFGCINSYLCILASKTTVVGAPSLGCVDIRNLILSFSP